MPVASSLPVWPGDRKPAIELVMSLESGDSFNVSHLSMNVHTGTHVDAPSHFIKGGTTVDALSLEALIGPAYVGYLPDVEQIFPTDLEGLEIPQQTKRLLLRTRNSQLWTQGAREFTPDYAALTPKAAEWIVKRGVWLVGVDYLSVQRFHDAEPTTHKVLLEAGVVILEGLNLSTIAPGSYQLLCLPLKLAGCEGAPARAVLVEEWANVSPKPQS